MPSISELLLEAGRARAAGHLGSGQALGQGVQRLGDILRQGMQDHQQAREAQQVGRFRDLQAQGIQADLDTQQRGNEREQGFMSAVGAGGGREAVLKRLEADPAAYQRAVQHFDEIDTSHKRLMGSVAAGVRDFGDSPDAAMIAIDDLIAKGYDERQMDGLRRRIQQQPDSLAALVDGLLLDSPEESHRARVRKPAEGYTLAPGAQRRGPNDELVAENPRAENPAQVGSFEDYVRRTYGDNPTPQQIVAGRKAYQQADDRPSVRVTGAGGLTPNMEANVMRQLTSQWTAASKPARDLDRQVGLIDAGMQAARRGDLAQGAQTVLVAFQKILDPNSVVREAEFDRSAAGQSLMNRVRGAAERLTKGGAGITLPELEKFHALAKEAAAAQRGSYLNSVKERIGRTADRYSIPRDLVFESPAVDAAPGGTQTIGRFQVEVAP